MENLSFREKTIYEYVEEVTVKKVNNHEFDHLITDAHTISIDFHLDRSNVSRILNKLFRKNMLVKIQGRPTYYLDRKRLSLYFPNNYIPSVITKNDTLENYIDLGSTQKKEAQKNYVYEMEDIIGSNKNESLHEEIIKGQIFATYPNHLYNCLIDGNISTGKTHLYKAISQFGIANGKYAKKIIEIDCNSALFFKDNIEKILFPLNNTDSNNEKINLVILRNIDLIPSELFFTCIKTVADQQLNNSERKSQLIFSTHEKLTPDKKSLLRPYISVEMSIPDLKNRTIKEVVEYILFYFQLEANEINKTIGLSKDVLSCLAMANYEGNLTSLQNEIRHAISKAYYNYVTKKMPTINLDLQDLSDNVLNSITSINNHLENFENICKIIEPFNLYFIPNITSTSFDKLHSSIVDDDGKVTDDKNKMISLSSVCKKEIQKHESIKLTAMKSIQVKSIYDCVFPIIDHRDFSISDKILYPFFNHLKKSIHNIQNRTYSQQYFDDHHFIDPPTMILGQKIITALEKKFSVTLPFIERQYINTYLSIAQTYLNEGEFPILIISFGDEIAQSYVHYIESLKFKVKIFTLNYTTEFQTVELNNFLQYVVRTVEQINQGKGVIILSDLNKAVDLRNYIFDATQIPSVIITPVSLNSLLQVVNIAERKESSIEDFKDINTLLLHDSMNDSANLIGFSNYFLFEFSQQILSQSLLFLDVKKSTLALTSVLANIYDKLDLNYSDEISIRFLHHCSFMIERVLKNESLTFKNKTKVIETNKTIFQVIEQIFNTINQQFGIIIPPDELAMVTEIFVDAQDSLSKDFINKSNNELNK